MDIKLIGNAYGAAEYTAAYVSKSEPDTTKFRDTINRALAKCSEDAEHHEVLRKVANASIAAREVSAQEALWILQNGLPMYGKSRNVLKVKTSPHAKRYYRVDEATCRLELMQDKEIEQDSHEIRVDPLEAAYMARPQEFDDMTYQHFAEHYEPTKAGHSDTQHLQRWARLDNKGYIKARREAQAVAKTPRVRADPDNPDYCFSEVMLRIPWRSLSDLLASKAESLARFSDLRASHALFGTSINTAIARQEQLQLQAQNNETPIALQPSELSLSRSNGDYNPQNLGREATPNTLPTCKYPPEDIQRAENFLTDVVRPYIKSQRDSVARVPLEGPPKRKQYQYPINLAESNMNADQWNAFAICMRQSRARKATMQNGATCEPLRMILNGAARMRKSWLVRHVVKDIHHVFNDMHIKTRNSRRVLLMAHHGTAAFNIKGSTICSALSLPRMSRRGYEKEYEFLSKTVSGAAKLRALQDAYASVQMVVIDEYSVISCAMLHWIDQRMKEIWPDCRHLPFGGRDVILVGDLGQLSPVSPAALFTPLDKLSNANQQAGRKLWEEICCVCNLTNQNRGKSDPTWYDALERLRKMEQTAADVELFNTRHAAPVTHNVDTKFIVYKNDDVDRANESFLGRQSQQVFCVSALHDVEPVKSGVDVTQAMQRSAANLLEAATTPNRDRDRIVRPSIKLAIGIPVSLSVNLEQQAGLCNGTKDVVFGFMQKPGAAVPIVLAEITDKYIGPSFLKDKANIVPITPHSLTWTARSVGMRTRRIGLPLRVAYAMTVHKVQGLTCSSLIFDPTDIPSSAFAYVGLSRV